MTLNDFSVNKFYSQFGEDGIIEEIFKRLDSKIKLDRWCCEFGAWDGVYLSNTCHFIRNLGFNAILIEANKNKVSELNKNFPSDNVLKIQKTVTFQGSNSLDNIFSETVIPLNFDFLSIDIDGADYHIFDSIKKYKPKVVCIEFNPLIPNSVEYVQPKDMKIKHDQA